MKPENREEYKKLVKFLALALGPDYEICLHDITDEGAYIAEIENNHISGRTSNSPLTGFALQLLKRKTYLERDYLINYKATAGDKKIRGSTLFLKDGDNLEGILCINYDKSRIDGIIEQLHGAYDYPPLDNTEGHEEKFSNNLQDLVQELTGISVKELHEVRLRPKQKQDIIDRLYEKGFFNLKGSKLEIAKILALSESSIYRCVTKSKARSDAAKAKAAQQSASEASSHRSDLNLNNIKIVEEDSDTVPSLEEILLDIERHRQRRNVQRVLEKSTDKDDQDK